MRLVAVSIVKNEADIIEAFVRHTRAWVDHHLIFDHDSTDGTRQILGALKEEGLPITLFHDDSSGHLQQARSNHLTRLAARDYGADWILPLDTDEILCAPSRTVLEQEFEIAGDEHPVSLPLLDYYRTTADDVRILNPVLRLRHCRSQPSHTRKVFVPRRLALDTTLVAGKGNHALYQGTSTLADRWLPAECHLAHLALRSPEQQVLRIVRAELQKQSRGQSATGLDVHYRLGYQLLSEAPELFLATTYPDPKGLRLLPIEYRGTPLMHTPVTLGWTHVARALLPYLNDLAVSHGRLSDAVGFDAAAPRGESTIREIKLREIQPSIRTESTAAFTGFVPRSGWGPQEGPVPEAFLPPFHWSYGPVTELSIHTERPRQARLVAEGLTYSENQTVRVDLNGVTVYHHAFGRVNQKETLAVPLTLQAGENRLSLHYSESLVTDHDARQLAMIYLSCHVLDELAS